MAEQKGPDQISIAKEVVPRLTPEQIFDYVGTFGRDIETYVAEAKAMYRMAQARGLPLDQAQLDEMLEPFKPMGDAELKLVQLRSQVNALKAFIYQQGLEVTHDELQVFMRKDAAPSSG